MLNWYRALRYSAPSARRALRNPPIIEIPTLFIWGDGDVALSIRTTLGTEKYVKNLTFRVLPGVSHWVQQEAPETVNQMLECWLTGKAVPDRTNQPRIKN